MFKRDLYKSLLEEVNYPEITFLLGARQVGKSFLMHKLYEELKTKYKCTFFDLEEPDILKQFNKDDEDIYKFIIRAGKIIFIDEFQYLKNASRIFKAIYDSKHKVKIFASGSSAIEMHKHIIESLAGRANNFLLKPLTIYEFSKQNTTQATLNQFLKYGGLPGVYKYNNDKKKQERLDQILKTYIQKDIKSLIKEENIRVFNDLIYFLAANEGQIIAALNLANDLRISRITIERYLSILEQTYVLNSLTSFSTNLTNELKKSKKYYLYDTGIRNILLKNFLDLEKRKDKGSIYESYVYHYLLSVRDVITDIHFWRVSDEYEVDFVWQRNQQTIPIEVKSKLYKDGLSLTKILRGVKSFLSYYPKSNYAVILNENLEDEIKYKDYTIYFYKFKNIQEINKLLLS